MEDRIERCAEKFGILFGAAPAGDEGTDSEFMKILQRFIFGEVCYTGTLSDEDRELVTVTVLAVNQTLPQLKAHVGAALNVGCTPVAIREAVYQCAPFIGFPKTLNAIAAMNEAFTAAGIALPLPPQATVADADRYEAGLALQAPLYGTEIADRYGDLPPEYAEAIPRFLTEFCFGDFASRNGLDEARRELLTVVMLAALGGAEVQVKAHVLGAEKAGNSRDRILAALVHAMPYMGIPRLFNALNAARSVWNQA